MTITVVNFRMFTIHIEFRIMGERILIIDFHMRFV